VAEVCVGVVAGVADVSDGGKAGVEHRAGVGDALNSAVAGRVEERGEEGVGGVAFAFDVEAHVGVRIEKPRHHRLARQVDDGGTRRDGKTRSHGLYETVFNQNNLILRGFPGRRIDQPARLDRDGLRLCDGGAQAEQHGAEQACAYEFRLHGSVLGCG
jgi:hypothetical protein